MGKKKRKKELNNYCFILMRGLKTVPGKKSILSDGRHLIYPGQASGHLCKCACAFTRGC